MAFDIKRLNVRSHASMEARAEAREAREAKVEAGAAWAEVASAKGVLAEKEQAVAVSRPPSPSHSI